MAGLADAFRAMADAVSGPVVMPEPVRIATVWCNGEPVDVYSDGSLEVGGIAISRSGVSQVYAVLRALDLAPNEG